MKFRPPLKRLILWGLCLALTPLVGAFLQKWYMDSLGMTATEIEEMNRLKNAGEDELTMTAGYLGKSVWLGQQRKEGISTEKLRQRLLDMLADKRDIRNSSIIEAGRLRRVEALLTEARQLKAIHPESSLNLLKKSYEEFADADQAEAFFNSDQAVEWLSIAAQVAATGVDCSCLWNSIYRQDRQVWLWHHLSSQMKTGLLPYLQEMDESHGWTLHGRWLAETASHLPFPSGVWALRDGHIFVNAGGASPLDVPLESLAGLDGHQPFAENVIEELISSIESTNDSAAVLDVLWKIADTLCDSRAGVFALQRFCQRIEQADGNVALAKELEQRRKNLRPGQVSEAVAAQLVSLYSTMDHKLQGQ